LNLPYLIPRIIRHFLPEKIVRALLLRNMIIESGLETNDPSAAAQRYVDVLLERNISLHGKRVLVFGYGGRFDLGFSLLREGATHVILCDKYAKPDEAHNLRMFANEKEYFDVKEQTIRPRPEQMTLVEADIRDVEVIKNIQPVDIVLSSSVYEHLDDVEGITQVLGSLTDPNGIHIHYVDLRDHFFKYPFEMLRFSESAWRHWLNPSSHHNRYRLWNYRSAFKACFENVEVDVLTREEAAFRKIESSIRREFKSGDMDTDSVATIRVIASKPLRG